MIVALLAYVVRSLDIDRYDVSGRDTP